MRDVLTGLIVRMQLQALNADVPNPDPVQPPGTGGVVTLLGWLKWGGLVMCIAGLIAAGGMMAIKYHRGEGGEQAGWIGKALIGVIVIGAAASMVGFLT
ncbi:hypothetical protein [Propionibacterium sp.]|uniref:hypothetical protein n=1 Tax=Propionibacterium sp. TaxID=1977903 RepID=UPI0039EB4FD7